jgi:hypothetical protein
MQPAEGSYGSTCCFCCCSSRFFPLPRRSRRPICSCRPPFVDHAVTRTDLAAERAAVVIFGLNLTLAALMLYVMIRYAGRAPGLAADDTAQVELRGFAGERKTAVLLQASAAVAGLLLPVIAVIFYLAVSMIYLIEPFREMDIHAPHAAPLEKP